MHIPDPRRRASPSSPTGAADDRPEAQWVRWTWPRGVLLATALLHTVAFPPFGVPEAAFVFVVPVFLYALRQPRWVEYTIVTYVAFLVSWLVLLHWLGHVTVVGTIALSAVMAVFPALWCAAARWAMPRAPWHNLLARLLAIAGLAGTWAVLEWIRSWMLTGFPWLTLATSMWERPLMLQGASVGGQWLVGFVLVFFGLALASYLQRIFLWVKTRRGRFAPEFYVAIVVLFVGTITLFPGRGAPREPVFRAGVMQPYVPQTQKWEEAQAPKILNLIEAETQRLATGRPEVILWPESVIPIPLIWNQRMNAWVERLANEANAPILAGAVAFQPDAGTSPVRPQGRWSNAMFLVEPGGGMHPRFYAKRHLVPFGEYVPLRRFIPFVEKFVPIGGDFTPGDGPTLLDVDLGDRVVRVGPLICYEDVFPDLARASVRAGAEVLFVGTNNGWYGETGAAQQHAAHSAVRAVETRRPVVRCGNHGWSGWINESGQVREVATDARGSIHFRGGKVFEVTRDPRWIGQETLYVRWGDWFVVLSAALAGAAAFVLRSPLFRSRGPLPRGESVAAPPTSTEG